MDRLVRFLIVLSLFFVSLSSKGAYDVEKRMNEILKMDMTPDDIMDSIGALLNQPEVNARDSLQASKVERFFRGRLLTHAKKNNFPATALAKLYDGLGLMYAHQGPDFVALAQQTFDKALEFGEAAGDLFRQGMVWEHKSQNTAKYGNMSDGFKFSEEAIKRYKKCGKEAESRIIRCYYTQAVAYLQGLDLGGMRRVIDSISSFSKRVSDENRLNALYNLYSVEEAYYGTKANEASSPEKEALFDSMNKVSLAAVLLIEANYDEWRTTSIDPTWNYYNRAVLFLNLSDRPNIDSVEYYLDKAITLGATGHTIPLEIKISAASVRAEAWMKLGNYSKAKDILMETVKLLDNTEGINNVIYDKIEIYKNLTEIARQSGHFEDALEFSSKVSALEKERFSEEKAKDIKELEIKYKTQETELALAQSEAQRSNTLMWLFAAVGLLLVAVIVFVVYAGRQRRLRMSREMEFASLKADIGRQLTKQYVEGLENERQRMSRELHDGVCNDLLAIQMNISGGRSLESTVELIDTCRESVRRISHELMPPEFSYASIEEVVRFFVAKQAKSCDGKVVISFSSTLEESSSWQEVSDSVALVIYRIVQEAVGNALKHSGATEINVYLTLDNNNLSADIRDNGTFKSDGRKGIGLESISRRAKSVNGTAEIISDEKTFTEVRVRIKI